MAFDFKRHLIKVQGGRQYLPVSARLIWFRSEHPDWGIETEAVEINHEKQYAVFRARIYNEDGKLMAMGTKKEDVKGFGDYIEKAETGAVGRALVLCGYGTQFSPDLDETSGGRFVDSPQPMGGNRFGGGNGGGSQGGSNRFGNGGSSGDGGARFTPPREFSAPPREDAPSRAANHRDEAQSRPNNDRGDAPARSGSSHDEAANRPSNSREDAPARPAPPREEAPARPAVVREEASVRPAADSTVRRPSPSPKPEDDDEFEALIGGTQPREVTEDDPFGEEDDPFGEDDAPAAAVAPKATATVSPSGMPACNNCGKALTKAQQELSIRNFGEALCPGCQRERPRTDRPAAAAR